MQWPDLVRSSVEVIYIWKIDQITAVTFEESRMTGKLFFKKVKGSNRFHSLSGDQMKGHTFILSLCVFDLMKIKLLITVRSIQDQMLRFVLKFRKTIVQYGLKPIVGDGLQQIIFSFDFIRLQREFRRGSQKDDFCIPVGLTQDFCGLHAVEHGHNDVQKYNIGRFFPVMREKFISVFESRNHNGDITLSGPFMDKFCGDL